MDRSNVIAFPSPRELRSRDNLTLAEDKKFLLNQRWTRWLQTPTTLKEQYREQLKKVVQDINSCLASVGRALGHRVWQGIENYIANHPHVCNQVDSEKEQQIEDQNGDQEKSKNENNASYENACTRAFEDQVVQKIMPKLRGIETEGHSLKHCIDPIGDIIKKHAPGLNEDYQNACDKGYGTFLWCSAKYLETEE